MRRQIELFLTAVGFLTRLPVPALRDFAPDWITRSARYYSLVGQIVGALMGAVLILAAVVWPPWAAALLAIAAGVLVTGAFHEDGLADTVDGLGGGKDAAQRLAIMKDSRIGSYGALALILALGLKAAALADIAPAIGLIVLVAGHGAARAAAVVVMRVLPYAGDPAAAKLKPAPVGAPRGEMLFAVVLALWPFLLWDPVQGLVAVALGGIAAAVMAWRARRLIGGYTGDVLGAVEQMFEVGFLLGAAAALLALS